jgi:hypothetical protein
LVGIHERRRFVYGGEKERRKETEKIYAWWLYIEKDLKEA